MDQDLWRGLVEKLPQGVAVWRLTREGDDECLVLAYANASFEQLMGLPLRKKTGQRLGTLFPHATPERIRLIADTCRSGGEQTIPAFHYPAPEAAADRLMARVISVAPEHAMVVVESVAVRERDAQAVREVSSVLDSLIEFLPAMVFVKDAETLRFERFNRAGEELLGVSRDALLGKNDYDLFPREQADAFVATDREVLARHALKETPREPIRTPRGTRWLHTRKIPIMDHANVPRFLLGVSIDITDQKRAEEVLWSSHEALERRVDERTSALGQQINERVRAEEALARTEGQLRHAQKMEAIGRLAGGVAHDFNNLLSAVLSYSDMILQHLPPESPAREYVEQISRAGSRASDLTHQLLAFSRRQLLRPRTLDLNDVLASVDHILNRVVGEDITLSVRSCEQLELVRADQSQLEQVLMNLVVNARDAMPTGGELAIETSNVLLDEDFAHQHLGAKPGAHVMLLVSDTGMGMDRATLARMYEPFFTTKETGRGTGLGLSTVLGIVEQSGGHVWADSELGRGTVFRVYLPAVAARSADAPEHTPVPQNVQGTETILLVEDDEQVRVLAATCLRELGYRVIDARDASAALAAVEAREGPIDLLLADVVMPGMGGRALSEHLVPRIPGLRVLFMSGYTDDAVVRHGIEEKAVAFLQKPITPARLSAKVREVLNARRDPTTSTGSEPAGGADHGSAKYR